MCWRFPRVSHTQSYDKAHQIKPPEFSELPLPTFARDKKMVETDVMALQYLLRNRGFYQARVDGEFGDLTEKAVRSFQRAKGLKVDGIVGPQTWAPLLLRLKRGDRGDAVRAFQTLLQNYNYDDIHGGPYGNQEVDGIFGQSTERKLRSFQKDKHLVSDGVVGPQTWNSLLHGHFVD